MEYETERKKLIVLQGLILLALEVSVLPTRTRPVNGMPKL